jgi:aspartate racemase
VIAPPGSAPPVPRLIGLVGGTGWLSTLEYYRLINQGINRALGGHEAARCILYSLNFGEIMRLKTRDPEQAAVRDMVVDAARTVANAGAECVLICANTLHWFAEAVADAVPVPLIHIATATAERVRAQGLRTVGLLGTLPTMERDFYTARLRDAGIATLVPAADDRVFVDHAILHELVQEIFRDEVKARFIDIMAELGRRGAEGIVLGCTEIPLLIKPGEADLPMFDTLRIHAQAAVDFALGAEA